jgi:hypothetical protein
MISQYDCNLNYLSYTSARKITQNYQSNGVKRENKIYLTYWLNKEYLYGQRTMQSSFNEVYRNGELSFTNMRQYLEQ